MPRFSTEHESDHTYTIPIVWFEPLLFLDPLEEDFLSDEADDVDYGIYPSLEHEEDTNDTTDEYG